MIDKRDLEEIKDATFSSKFVKFARYDLLDIELFRNTRENSTLDSFIADVERLENEIEESLIRLRKMREHLERGKKAFEGAKGAPVKIKRGGKAKKYVIDDVVFYTTPTTMDRIHQMSLVEGCEIERKWVFANQFEQQHIQGFIDFSKFEMALDAIGLTLEQYAQLAGSKKLVFEVIRNFEELGDYLHCAGMVFTDDEDEEEVICKDRDKYREACINLARKEIERGGIILFQNIGILTLMNW